MTEQHPEALVTGGAPAPSVEDIVDARLKQVLGSFQPQAQSFEDALGQVDPADSDAALAMLDFLLKTGRLGRVGVLDGGQGYLFVYQEPKGASKQGYRPGATQGDRIVDEAVNAQREAGNVPVKRSICQHCMNAVLEVPGTDEIVTDDGVHNDACAASPTGKHVMA